MTKVLCFSAVSLSRCGEGEAEQPNHHRLVSTREKEPDTTNPGQDNPLINEFKAFLWLKDYSLFTCGTSLHAKTVSSKDILIIRETKYTVTIHMETFVISE